MYALQMIVSTISMLASRDKVIIELHFVVNVTMIILEYAMVLSMYTCLLAITYNIL
jgi:hypothetical protein